MASVSFQDVYKVYPNGYSAIKKLCLDIQDGEFLVFVGPSGCGKSTALRMLAGLEDISAGKLLIGDRVVNDQTPQERNIAMVFQNYALYPHMTVRQNLEFPLRMIKLSPKQRQARIAEAAEKLGLAQLLDRKPKQLSGGQRQRVAMGRAIVRDPAVFLMDEPLSNLDAKMRSQIRTEIAELQDRMGTTTVYVTHDQVEAMTMGDRVAVMRGGELQQLATPQDLYDSPANVFVAGFIGSPAMNIFPTQLRKTALGLLMLDVGDQRLAIDPAAISRYSTLANYLDQPLLAGLRPEAFSVADANPPPDSCLQVEVKALEALGHEMIIYAQAPVGMIQAEEAAGAESDLNTSTLVARLAANRNIHAHTPLALAVDVSKLYLFTTDYQAIG
ncbi:MAG: sn-glycerol-3-phosphate ABC transporter ATP-binding protein UgpC [Aphanocapsa sp. GSE-SYN-MK-11-07L]|jgi:multiple sugar transport system ATP-binding protein|nr:sn-glycerol-3-phosphate ABC transporter ATP-binding protein UgpC [Aphanocapsa sp. GSE-SYN-MK-11-07L]